MEKINGTTPVKVTESPVRFVTQNGLNQINPILNEGSKEFDIYFSKPEYRSDYMMGYEFLVEHTEFLNRTIAETHMYIGTIKANDLDDVYYKMQGDVYSPEGQARPFIESIGIRRTSMSVGDVIFFNEEYYMVDNIGFVRIA